MDAFPKIDPALLKLAGMPVEDRVFRMSPKGGRFNFIAWEDEVLKVVREKLPREHAPYLVTFSRNTLLRSAEGNERIERLDDFQGWLKNMTLRVRIWPESLYQLVTRHECRELMAVVGSLMLAVEHRPLELFGQNKIAESESRVWAYGSVRSYHGSGDYVNAESMAMYSPVQRGIKRLCMRAATWRLPSGEVVEMRGVGMTEKAAQFFARLPGVHQIAPGRLLKPAKSSKI